MTKKPKKGKRFTPFLKAIGEVARGSPCYLQRISADKVYAIDSMGAERVFKKHVWGFKGLVVMTGYETKQKVKK